VGGLVKQKRPCCSTRLTEPYTAHGENTSSIVVRASAKQPTTTTAKYQANGTPTTRAAPRQCDVGNASKMPHTVVRQGVRVTNSRTEVRHSGEDTSATRYVRPRATHTFTSQFYQRLRCADAIAKVVARTGSRSAGAPCGASHNCGRVRGWPRSGTNRAGEGTRRRRSCWSLRCCGRGRRSTGAWARGEPELQPTSAAQVISSALHAFSGRSCCCPGVSSCFGTSRGVLSCVNR
jgi:hypothetical protein